MKRSDHRHIILLLIFTLCLSGCIKNDIPYPRIKAQILDITAEGQVGTATIDNTTQTVNLVLADTVNLKKVHIESLNITEGAISDMPTDSILDLSKNYTLTLSIYQDYLVRNRFCAFYCFRTKFGSRNKNSLICVFFG